MSTWILPYVDQPLDFWQEVGRRFGPQVQEVYFPVPGRQLASGRPPQPEGLLRDFLQRAPLPKAVLVNPIVLPRPVEAMGADIVAILRRLEEEFGIRRVTIANPALGRRIKEDLPGWHVSASVLMGVASPAQAWLVQDGVDAITVDNRLVRDLAGLRQMRAAFSGEIRLIVNEACLPGCLFRTQHFYEMGYGSEFPQSLCQGLLEERPWLRLTGAWILPRHLHHYDGLCNGLKLAGRVTLRDPERYLAVLGAYVNREAILPRDIGGGPASPLAAIDVSDEWFEYVLRCDKRCDACSVCREQYEQALHNQEEDDGRRGS